LIHPRIGEEEGRVGEGDDGGGRHEGVALLFGEVIDERLTDSVQRPFFCGGGGGGGHAEEKEGARGGAAVWWVPVAGVEGLGREGGRRRGSVFDPVYDRDNLSDVMIGNQNNG